MRLNKLICRSLALITCVCSVGCISKKESLYFSDPGFKESISIENSHRTYYRLQPRDVISVRIKTLDGESSSYFNIDKENMYMNINPAVTYLNGYSVDTNGNIEMPEIGAVNVKGLTLKEAEERIQNAVEPYLTKATIIVKLVSFKVTILGEVRNPGVQYFYNDQVTLFEGLGSCGDITEYGNRRTVNVIRQTPSGQNVVILNLNQPDVLSSENLYLQPNDVIYVPPLRAKITRGNLATLTVATLVLSIITTTIIVTEAYK